MNTALFSGSDLDVVFSLVLTMSLSASWIAAAVLVLRLCLKRAPKWVNVLLWGIVAVRLVLPVSIESPLSLLPRTEAILPAVTAQPIQAGSGSGGRRRGSDRLRRGHAAAQPVWTTILAWVWLVGIAVLLLYTWISTQRLRRKVREAVRLRGNIYETEHIASPFVLGVLRPRIYLPYHMDSRDREQVIAHEQAHLRRGDHVWKPLGFLLLTIHWFNPLLWLSYVLLCRDIELACDEKVIKHLKLRAAGRLYAGPCHVQCEPPQNCGLPARLRRDRGKGACKICDELQKTDFLDHSSGRRRLRCPGRLLSDESDRLPI